MTLSRKRFGNTAEDRPFNAAVRGRKVRVNRTVVDCQPSRWCGWNLASYIAVVGQRASTVRCKFALSWVLRLVSGHVSPIAFMSAATERRQHRVSVRECKDTSLIDITGIDGQLNTALGWAYCSRDIPTVHVAEGAVD
ncbi:hypothetical protein RR46_09371 [Papilio xuthus]|uniref:Uncharacterized protein n=1 Tax=Papilio xuthus TaxID=66420 RepID=A0A194PXH7_PAPXU|nr:hypothetical protein RR46_09371 [Papilio xuthus]